MAIQNTAPKSSAVMEAIDFVLINLDKEEFEDKYIRLKNKMLDSLINGWTGVSTEIFYDYLSKELTDKPEFGRTLYLTNVNTRRFKSDTWHDAYSCDDGDAMWKFIVKSIKNSVKQKQLSLIEQNSIRNSNQDNRRSYEYNQKIIHGYYDIDSLLDNELVLCINRGIKENSLLHQNKRAKELIHNATTTIQSCIEEEGVENYFENPPKLNGLSLSEQPMFWLKQLKPLLNKEDFIYFQYALTSRCSSIETEEVYRLLNELCPTWCDLPKKVQDKLRYEEIVKKYQNTYLTAPETLDVITKYYPEIVNNFVVTVGRTSTHTTVSPRIFDKSSYVDKLIAFYPGFITTQFPSKGFDSLSIESVELQSDVYSFISTIGRYNKIFISEFFRQSLMQFIQIANSLPSESNKEDSEIIQSALNSERVVVVPNEKCIRYVFERYHYNTLDAFNSYLN